MRARIDKAVVSVIVLQKNQCRTVNSELQALVITDGAGFA